MSACSKLALNMVMDQEAKLPQKQGIVSILTSDCERSTRSVASLRRTLSADMSSKQWLSQNGFISVSPLKKIASSKEFSECISEYSSSTDGDEEDENYEKNQDKEKPGELDIWSMIVSQSKNKDQEQAKSAAPYIHPLLKRSASALSKKSLEVCTESLGSETGSDEFSSSEVSEKEEEQPPKQQQQSCDYEDVKVVKYNFAAVGKKLPPPSFPPPLPSLLSRRDGASLHMKPRRENGRLVLEAVSVSAQNNLKAERQDGRLVLTFVNAAKDEEAIQEEKEDRNSDGEGDYEDEGAEAEGEEEEEERTRGRETEIMMEQESKMSGGVIKLHRLALMMNKSASLAAMKNPTCPHKLSQEEKSPLAPVPPVGHLVGSAPAASFNAYDYCWRAKPTAAQAIEKSSNNNKYVISKNNSSIIADKDQHLQEMVMMKGIKADYNYIVPNLKGCKEHRIRSLFWEPYCVATS